MVAVLALGGSGFLPLFGGPGYEASLAAGLLLPATAAVATSIESSATSAPPFEAYARGAASGAALGGLGFALAMLHGLRVGFCDLAGGAALFLLAPAVGAVLGGVWGGLAGMLAAPIRRRGLRLAAAALLGLAGPLLTLGFSLWRFFESPMVFAFDPFFGHFAGPLYDTVIEPADRLASYRTGSLLTLLGVGVGSWHLERGPAGVRLIWRGRPGIALCGAAAAIGSLALALAGAQLGHFSTKASIRAELERSLVSGRCEIVYAPSIPLAEAEILGRECQAHLTQLERFFETQAPDRTTVFVFESEAQKGRLMGAAHTYIAKPWRSEVYVQFARTPHPVLGHELAHVVAGSFGQGPFRVAGPFRGWLPDPGRIEGVATAAAPSDDPDFTLQQWARTMLDLGLLPPLGNVFRLSFFGESSAKAYTVAGAFVQWLHATHGAATLRRWYGGEELSAITGKDLVALERDWRAALQGVSVSPKALETARARFDRPSVFGRKCPHVVDRLMGEGHGRLGQGDFVGAAERFDRVLELDPGNFRARLGLGSCALRAGDDATARRRWDELAADAKLHRMLRLEAEETGADLDLLRGDVSRARARYASIGEAVVDGDHLRQLEVKSQPGSELGRRAISSLLLGDPRRGRDFGEAASLLGRWSAEEPDQGLADYLLGRNFYLGGRYEEAATRLDEALGRKLPSDRVLAEALRIRLIVACALGDRPAAQGALARSRALEGREPGTAAAVERLAERCGL